MEIINRKKYVNIWIFKVECIEIKYNLGVG